MNMGKFIIKCFSISKKQANKPKLWLVYLPMESSSLQGISIELYDYSYVD